MERTLEGGRLDTERYLWQVPKTNPFELEPVSEDPADLHLRLAEIFFQAAGVAPMRGFAAWAGIPQRDARAAMERLPLIPVSVPHQEQTCFMLEKTRQLIDRKVNPDRVALLPCEDNLVSLHGGPALLLDERYHQVMVPQWGRKAKAPLGEVGHYALRSLLVGNEIAGFWEYDPVKEEIAHVCFSPPHGRARANLQEEIEKTATFLRDELGHGKSVTLDNNKSLGQRAEFIRTM